MASASWRSALASLFKRGDALQGFVALLALANASGLAGGLLFLDQLGAADVRALSPITTDAVSDCGPREILRPFADGSIDGGVSSE